MKVSVYKNAFAKEQIGTIDFIDWSLDSKHKVNVLAVRKGLGKKDQLECVLPGGIFSDRGLYSCIKPSGLLYVDIDSKDNTDILKARKLVITDPHVILVQASTGGKGLSVVYKIAKASKEQYNWYYRQVEALLSCAGIKADKACKNINRIKFASYDPKPYVNLKAKTLKLTYKPPKIKPVEVQIDTALKKDILDMVALLDSGKVDITGDYNDWLYLAGMLHLVFGYRQGLTIFHRISKFYANYSAEEATSKYDYCTTFKDANPKRFFTLLKAKPIK